MFRVACVAVLLALGVVRASSQETVAEWQAEAVKKYSELGRAGSPFNTSFVARYNELKISDRGFFNDPKWPMILARRCAGESDSIIPGLPAPVESSSPAPSNVESLSVRRAPGVYLAPVENNEILFDEHPGGSSHHELHVTNGSMSDAIAKLINTRSQRKEMSFAISGNSTAGVMDMPEGDYTLIFAFGSKVYQDANGKKCDRFADPSDFSRLDKTLTFRTTQDANNIYTAVETITITPVPGGNVTKTAISKDEYEQW